MDLHDGSFELACVKRDALVDRLLRTRDYRAGSPGWYGLNKYLIGHGHGNPNGIPTELRQAQEDALELMKNQVKVWRT